MADKMRWRYGETNPVVGVVPAEINVEIGDLLYYDTDQVKPAGYLVNHSSNEENQIAFAEKFIGVAMQRSQSGEATQIRIATTGVFEFDTPVNTFVLGTMITPSENRSKSGIENQQVTSTSNKSCAIGRVVRREPVNTSTVLVSIKSTITEGGINNH